jgi:hypothetical protein
VNDFSTHKVESSSSSELFFDAVQHEMDGGRDPLDRADLIAWLELHPEALDEFASLRALHLSLVDSAAGQIGQATQATEDGQTGQAPQAPQATQAGQAGQAATNKVLPWRAVSWLAAAAALLLLVIVPEWGGQVKERTEVQRPPNQPPSPSTETDEADEIDAPIAVPPRPAQVLTARHTVREVQTAVQRSHQPATGVVILSLKTSTRRVVSQPRT